MSNPGSFAHRQVKVIHTVAIQGPDIERRFVHLVQWARGGHLDIVTPFIEDFPLGVKNVSDHVLQIARQTSTVRLLVAPPNPTPHVICNSPNPMECHTCMGAAKKIDLLDKYSKFTSDLLVKTKLHAKIYTATDWRGIKKCLTGSINLTKPAFFKNAELGVYTTDADLIQQIEQITTFWKASRSFPEAEEYRAWRKDFVSRYKTVAQLLEMRDKWS